MESTTPVRVARQQAHNVQLITNATSTDSCGAAVLFDVRHSIVVVVITYHNTAYTCALSSDVGRTCGSATTRWYFDSQNRRCISFTYYGCDGNPNNFASKYLCETYCGVGGSFPPEYLFHFPTHRLSQWRCRVSRNNNKLRTCVQSCSAMSEWLRVRYSRRRWQQYSKSLLSNKRYVVRC